MDKVKQSLALKISASSKQGPAGRGRAKLAISQRGRKKKNEIVEEVAPVRKRPALPDRSVMQIRVLSTEHRELKQVVDEEVRSPPHNLKRRATIQNIAALLPREAKIEKEDIEERTRIIHEIEDKKQKRLEWRAQFAQLQDAPPLRREKSEHHRIKYDLLRTVHPEDSEGIFRN